MAHMIRRILTATAFIGAISIAGAVPFLDTPETALPDDVTADSIVVEKSAHRMSLFKNGQLLRSYRVALGHGGPEAKSREGDARTPEGSYFIDGRNRRSYCQQFQRGRIDRADLTDRTPLRLCVKMQP